MPAPKPDGSIQVLHKAAAVLDLLAERGELTVAEIAEATSEPRSSVYRLLGSLEELGMVEPGARPRTHRLGLGLLRLGTAVSTRFDERQASLPAMESLHDETGETVFLCIRRGLEAVCIERLDGQRVQSLALRLGGSLPLHAGAAPSVLLAFEPESEWDRYAAEAEMASFTDRTATSSRQLHEQLGRIRQQGYAVSDEDVTPGIAAVGAPVFDYSGQVRAALSISGTKPTILGDDAGMIERVTAAAASASHALGYRPAAPARS